MTITNIKDIKDKKKTEELNKDIEELKVVLLNIFKQGVDIKQTGKEKPSVGFPLGFAFWSCL